MNAKAGVEIRAMELGDVEQVVALHAQTLGLTFNSRLGPRHLRRLYEAIVRSGYGECFVAARGKNVVGCVSGSERPKRFMADLLRKYPKWELIKVGIHVLFSPWLLMLRFANRSGESDEATLTTLFVAENERHSGLGRELLKNLESFFAKRGISSYRLDVENENTDAQHFYERCGFRKISDGGRSAVFAKEIL